jgi:PAS domain S-box-containing protein
MNESQRGALVERLGGKPFDSDAAFLASIVESSDDAIISKDLNGVIVSWNRGAEHIFGYGAAEVIGRPVSILIPPDHADEEPRILERIRRGERVDHYETVRRRKDGSKVDVSLTISPIKDAEGRVIGASKIARDVTQNKRMEEELAKAHAILEERARNLETAVAERTTHLQQTIADLETFSYTVSHDLRSPLRAMQGFAQALLAGYADKLDDEGRGYLQRISNSAIRMDKLILEVLTYSRAGSRDLPIKPVDLDKLIDEVIQTYPSIRESNGDITIQHPLHPVLGSRASLAQVVSNLLTNAVKFVSVGAKAKIRIRTEKNDSKVRCFFEDTGIGIPQNYLSKIFEPFQRAHPHANYEGTGMGLAIVRKAVERMDGIVGVESQEGHGSTFWMELPAAEL